MSGKNWLKFLYLGLVWGASFLWMKIGIEESGPVTFNAIRLFIAATGLGVLTYMTRSQLPGRKNLGSLFLLGVINIALPFVLITWGQKYISTGMASILNSTVPLFTIIIAPIFVPEDGWSLPKAIGLLLGFTGVVVLMSNRVQMVEPGALWGQAAILLAALSYAVAAVYARRKTHGLAPSGLAFGQAVSANLVLWPVAAAAEAPLTLPARPLTWLAAIWLGVMATCLGTAIYYSLLKEVGPTRTTLTTYVFPLVGVILGVLFLKETASWHLVVGGILIVSGVAVVNSRLSFLQRRASERKSSS